MSNIIQQPIYKKYVIDSRLQYFKPNSSQVTQNLAEEISLGLNRESKYIHPKFFYDKKGSDLFEKICTLPEYYITRTEIAILEKLTNVLPGYLDDSFRLVELGSGSSTKTRLILDMFTQIQDRIEYFPIDISEILTESSELLQKDYATLHITGIIDTYEGGVEFLQKFDDKKNLIIFLGSSFGNFLPHDGKNFLQKISSSMKKDDLFLIGLDLVKNNKILEKAYNDANGITAQFNLNVLSRINDELDADFDVNNFEHHAVFNQEKNRIEMYLRSLVEQSIYISKSNISVHLSKNELIHTEYSHKFTLPQIEELMVKSGFSIKHIWIDDNRYFALVLASKIKCLPHI